MKRLRIEFMLVNCKKDSPTAATMPNITQYIAANIGNGMEANSAPNFPSMEKKIMNPAEICITLLLPTLVDPRRPTFSTETVDPVPVPNRPSSKVPIPCHPMPLLSTYAGGGVALANRAAAMKAPVVSINDTTTAAIIPNA